MKKILYFAIALATFSSPLLAQENAKMRDPKVRSERIAEKLQFSQEQKQKLHSLNEKYKGNNYNKEAYRKEFHDMLTVGQKQQLQEWRKKHKHNPVKRA
jgi:hypothetical protein